MSHATFTCACGAFEARLAPAGPRDGDHVVCYCRDCRAYARHLANGAVTNDDQGGSALYITAPDRIEIIKGAEHLACLRMTPKGPLRWYAACCGTPFANTAGSPRLPFASLPVAYLSGGGPGPVRARLETQEALAPMPAFGRTGVMARVMLRVLRYRLTGAWRKTPFFDDTGRARAKPERLSSVELEAAYGD